jgi:hypothetical protein
VREVEFFSKLIASDAPQFRFARRFVLPVVARTPLQSRIKRTVTGLDHALPAGLEPSDVVASATQTSRPQMAL